MKALNNLDYGGVVRAKVTSHSIVFQDVDDEFPNGGGKASLTYKQTISLLKTVQKRIRRGEPPKTLLVKKIVDASGYSVLDRFLVAYDN